MLLRNLIFLIFVSSCSSPGLLTKKYPVKDKAKLTTLKFIPQEEFQCGPASLAMMYSHLGMSVDEKVLSSMVFTPDKNGSFQSDMIAAVRRQKLLPLPVRNVKDLLLEVDAGNPVLVLQNLGLNWVPRWHYAVVVGYDLKKSEIILHSGTESYMKIEDFPFNKTWERSGRWGMVVVKPGTVPITSEESDIVKAIAHLEAQSYLTEAQLGYESVLEKFPNSLGSHIGLGNIYFSQKKFPESVRNLKLATNFHPQSAEAWHNLALAYKSNSEISKAKEAARMAIKLCAKDSLPRYEQSLNDLI